VNTREIEIELYLAAFKELENDVDFKEEQIYGRN